MAASILSFGMLTARAFWITRRSIGFECGSVPPDFTAMLMSFAIRANCFAMRFHRANIVCLRTSNIRPIGGHLSESRQLCGELGRIKASELGELRQLCRQLRGDQAHTAALGAQSGLDLAQALLDFRVLPMLDHD